MVVATTVRFYVYCFGVNALFFLTRTQWWATRIKEEFHVPDPLQQCVSCSGNTNTLSCNSMVVVTIVSHMFRLDYPLGSDLGFTRITVMQHPSWTSPSSSFCPSSLLAFIQDCIKIIDTPNCLILHDHPNFKTSITSQCWQNLCGNCSKQKFLFFCGLQKSAPLKIKKTSYINSRWSLFPSKKPYHINLRCFSFLLWMYVCMVWPSQRKRNTTHPKSTKENWQH